MLNNEIIKFEDIINSIGFQNITEIGIDNFIENEVVKSIPVVSTIFSICKGIVSIPDRIFLSKLTSFIKGIICTDEEKKAFVEKMNADENFKYKIYLDILNIVDKMDDLDKSSLLGKVFTEFLKGNIDRSLFKKISYGINATFISDLDSLLGENFNKINEPTKLSLISSGFVIVLSGYGSLVYKITDLGIKFVSICKYR